MHLASHLVTRRSGVLLRRRTLHVTNVVVTIKILYGVLQLLVSTQSEMQCMVVAQARLATLRCMTGAAGTFKAAVIR